MLIFKAFLKKGKGAATHTHTLTHSEYTHMLV